MNIIGLDLGTSRVKAVRFDASWRAVDTEGEQTVVNRTHGGRREQLMPDVWAAAVRALRAVAERSHDPIDLVAVTGQGDGCWLVDSHGDPVRPAMLWNDNRAAPLVDRWRADGTLDQAFSISGSYGAPGLPNAQLRWLLENEPDSLTHGATLLSCGSWVYYRLTGRRVLEATDAANPFFGAASAAYDPELLALFGLTRLRRLLPDAVRGPDCVAPLTDSSLGLPAGTPVCLAPYDVPATAIGVGAVAVGATFTVLGTTLCVGTVSDDPQLSRAPNGMTLPATRDGEWLVAAATLAGTEVLDWAAALTGAPDAAAFVQLATTSQRRVLPIVLPYLSSGGERSPFLDKDIRGTVHRLDLGHTRADVARAVLEGLTMVVADCVDYTGATGTLALCGGGARSALWCQLISDVTGRTVTSPDTAEVGARGAAITGAVDVGAFPDAAHAVAAAVRPRDTYHPEPALTSHYAQRRSEFLALRSATSTRPGERT